MVNYTIFDHFFHQNYRAKSLNLVPFSSDPVFIRWCYLEFGIEKAGFLIVFIIFFVWCMVFSMNVLALLCLPSFDS